MQGRQQFELYQKWATLGFAIVQAFGQLSYIRPYVDDYNPSWLFSSIVTLTTGSMILTFVSPFSAPVLASVGKRHGMLSTEHGSIHSPAAWSKGPPSIQFSSRPLNTGPHTYGGAFPAAWNAAIVQLKLEIPDQFCAGFMVLTHMHVLSPV